MTLAAAATCAASPSFRDVIASAAGDSPEASIAVSAVLPHDTGGASRGAQSPSAAAHQAPLLEVERYSVEAIDLGGSPRLMIRGTVHNAGPGLASNITVRVQVLEFPGGPPLTAPAIGPPLVRVVAAGESAPFILISHGSDPEARGYEFSVTGDSTSQDRYRGLQAEVLVDGEAQPGERVFGAIRNAGEDFPNVSGMSASVVFWNGADIVATDALVFPQVQLATDAAQTILPGGHLAFRYREALTEYDRVEYWFNVKAFPEGTYPLSLSSDSRHVELDDSEGSITATARVWNCGVADMTGVVAVVEGRDAAGRLVGFVWLAVAASTPIPPGGAALLRVGWPSATPVAAADELTLLIYSLDVQPVPGQPCALPASGIFFPVAVARDAGPAEAP